MTRRSFLIASVAAPLLTACGSATPASGPASTATPKVRRIGLIKSPSPSLASAYPAFERGLADLGRSKDGNLAVVERPLNAQTPEAIAALMAEFKAQQAEVIVGTVVPQVVGELVKSAAPLPVVHPLMTSTTIGTAEAASLARPGGTLTGLVISEPQQYAKRLELLKEAVAGCNRAALLYSWDVAPADGSPTGWPELQTRSAGLGVQVERLRPGGAEDVERAIDEAAQRGVSGVVVWQGSGGGAMAAPDIRKRALAQIEALRLPSIGAEREWATDGGLLAFAPSLVENYRRAAVYVDKILKGAKAGELPIELPSKFEFVVNQKAATTMGLPLPKSILVQATEVVG